jgi:hypothetical protein
MILPAEQSGVELDPLNTILTSLTEENNNEVKDTTPASETSSASHLHTE